MKSLINISAVYKKNDVSTAEPRELIVMLYGGAIRFLDIALKNMHYSTYDICSKNIIKSQNIITELFISLDRDKGGDIAQNLSDIYSFLNKELLEANIYKNSDKIIFVRKILDDLKKSWENIQDSFLSIPSDKNSSVCFDSEASLKEKQSFLADC